MQRLSRGPGLFGSAVNRSPSTKILNSGTPIQMQQRNCYPGYRENFLLPIGILAGILTSPFFAYKSWKYFHNNNDKNTNLNEINVSEDHSSRIRPGKM